MSDKEGGQKSGEKKGKPKKLTTQEDAARIQSAEAKKNDGKVAKGGHAARAQAPADKRADKNNKT